MPRVALRTVKKTAGGTSATQWHTEVKMKAATMWSKGLSTGDINRELGVPIYTLQTWRKTDWWKEAQQTIREEQLHVLDKKVTDVLDKSVEEISDRLKSGDSLYDPKTGRVKRVPVKLRDLNTTFSTMMDTRQTIRNLPSKIIDSSNQAALANLALEFAKFVNKKTEPKPQEVLEMIEGETVVKADNGDWVLAMEVDEYNKQLQLVKEEKEDEPAI